MVIRFSFYARESARQVAQTRPVMHQSALGSRFVVSIPPSDPRHLTELDLSGYASLRQPRTSCRLPYDLRWLTVHGVLMIHGGMRTQYMIVILSACGSAC
jgi:hypothetical protein